MSRLNTPKPGVVQTIVNRYLAEGVPHRTLRDGQAIVIEGEKTIIC